jgi:hypothetical protein
MLLKFMEKIFILRPLLRKEVEKMRDTTFDLEPRLLRLHYGGWMALTGVETPVRIGVVGASEDEARASFAASVTRWRELGEVTLASVPSNT